MLVMPPTPFQSICAEFIPLGANFNTKWFLSFFIMSSLLYLFVPYAHPINAQNLFHSVLISIPNSSLAQLTVLLALIMSTLLYPINHIFF